jgi:hypothetical protein
MDWLAVLVSVGLLGAQRKILIMGGCVKGDKGEKRSRWLDEVPAGEAG